MPVRGGPVYPPPSGCPELTPEQVGTGVSAIATGSADDRGAYLLTAADLSPVQRCPPSRPPTARRPDSASMLAKQGADRPVHACDWADPPPPSGPEAGTGAASGNVCPVKRLRHQTVVPAGRTRRRFLATAW